MIDILTRLVHDKVGNSLSKYPSIPTYNKMEKGLLSTDVENYDEMKELYITEKIDGTNTRIIVCGSDYIIGSRDEWIYAKGDRVLPTANRKHIEYLIPFADKITSRLSSTNDTVLFIYGELYGYKIQKWQNYTNEENDYGYRVFDMFSLSVDELNSMLDTMSPDQASIWRDNNNQPWYPIDKLKEVSSALGLLTVPYIKREFMKEIGFSVCSANDFLKKFSETNAELHANDNKKAEGIVVRTFDRSYISKLRFEDYNKYMKRKKEC